MIEYTIEKVPDGISVSRFIGRGWPLIPSHVIDELFRARDVKLDGRRVGPEQHVSSGQKLTVYLPDRYLPQQPDILFSDGKLIAVCKAQGLPVDKDADGIGVDTLLSRMQTVYPSCRLCHRLDAVTGGLVFLANDDAVYRAVTNAFKVHRVRKTYLALVKGPFPPDKKEATLKDRLIADKKTSFVSVARGKDNGLIAEMRYRVLRNGDTALAALEPFSGRTHQLRVQMAHAGHPILRDDKYGDRAYNKAATGQVRLWCHSMYFSDDDPALLPYRGMRFETSLPVWAADAPI